MSFPPATEMFQFTGFASRTYGFSAGYSLLSGLPHSEIPGSTIARISPGLFAACHVLHRLLAPRHPPNALTSTLDRSTRRPQGQAPQNNASRMKTLFSEEAVSPQLSAISWAQKRDASSVLPLHLSKIKPASRAGKNNLTQSLARRWLGAPLCTEPLSAQQALRLTRPATTRSARCAVVEVNGIEPMTSCLQSRRSPN